MRLQENHINVVTAIGTIGSLVVVLLLFAIFCPTVKEVTAAEQDGIQTLASVNVTPTIAIAASTRVQLEVTPKSTGSFSTSTTDLVVSTNSRSGYSLYMSTTDGSQTLKSQNGLDATIAPTASGATESTFANNTWGYSLDSGTNKVYQPVPASSKTAIKQTDTSSSENHYDLTFGVMIDTSLPAGQYSNMVAISAIANPMVITSISDLYYMQDMTKAICDSTPINSDWKNPVTTQLIDTRDGKKYWVAKLADGRCWMTQNLAFDIKINSDGTSNVKAADSNVKSDWNVLPSDTGWTASDTSTSELRSGYTYTYYKKSGSIDYYPPIATEYSLPVAVNTPGQATPYSWNLGEYVLTNPTSTTSCGDITHINSCVSTALITHVPSDTWKPTYTATNTTAIDRNAKTYDPHYLLGNYYQWNAATAGTGATITNTDASGSICPKGWQLPTNNSSMIGSFSYLLGRYGLQNNVSGSTTQGNFKADEAPLYFVRSGQVNMQSGKINHMGIAGIWRSSTAGAYTLPYEAMAYDFVMNAATNPNSTDQRQFGLSIRCVNNPNI